MEKRRATEETPVNSNDLPPRSRAKVERVRRLIEEGVYDPDASDIFGIDELTAGRFIQKEDKEK